MRKHLAILILLAIAPIAQASVGVNVPVVGRVVGGGVLFLSAVDVTNQSDVKTAVTYYFDGANVRTGEPLSLVGSISDSGIVTLGAGTMPPRSNQHFDDFVDALVRAGRLPQSIESDGILGSVLFVFESATKSGQGAATVRVYNNLSGGFVSVAVKGHEIQQNEPQKLIVVIRDSRAHQGEPQIYPNLFINNTGLTPAGAQAGSVTVHVSAVSTRTGQPVGNTIDLNIGPGLVGQVGQAFQALGIDTAVEDSVLITVAVTSGTAAIEGIVSQVDEITRDGAAFEMSRADF